MPTARPRHMITETDEIAAAIDAAAHRWPDAAGNRAEIIRRIVAASADASQEERRGQRQAMAEVLDRIRGYGITYPPDWRETLRDEWPE